jgi:hypothetical protein
MISVWIRRHATKDIECIHVKRGTRICVHTFYPDSLTQEGSDFPLAGISLQYKCGHLILQNEHRLKSPARTTIIDLEYFSPEWQGCSVFVKFR